MCVFCVRIHAYAYASMCVCVCVCVKGFGVGALEDEDEDIYATESMCSYDQTMELDDSEQFFGWTAPGARKKKGKQGGLL